MLSESSMIQKMIAIAWQCSGATGCLAIRFEMNRHAVPRLASAGLKPCTTLIHIRVKRKYMLDNQGLLSSVAQGISPVVNALERRHQGCQTAC
jgi:hypothetical protein